MDLKSFDTIPNSVEKTIKGSKQAFFALKSDIYTTDGGEELACKVSEH